MSTNIASIHDPDGLAASMARHPSRFVPEGVATCCLCGIAWDHDHDWSAELAYDPETDGRYGPS